jgi:RNA polymerase sigma factor (sigma-70 family)
MFGRNKVMMNGRQTTSLSSRYLPSCVPKEELSDEQLLEAFVRHRDEAAFSALMRRHGPMVLGVCRRVLRHADDADDAFQATFLVLVHKAASLQQPNLLASWLHGVAYRTAQHARVRSARRHRHEREAASMAPPATDHDTPFEEMREALDDELQRLPEFYRAPLVLCYLEGKTNVEAAHILGWPTGSMSARLAKARGLLRERLTRRRRALPAGILLPVLLQQHAHLVMVPGSLVEATLQAVRGLTAGKTLAGGLVSPAIRALTEASLRSLAGKRRWRLALCAALLLALLGLATSAYASSGGDSALARGWKALGLPSAADNQGTKPPAGCH